MEAVDEFTRTYPWAYDSVRRNEEEIDLKKRAKELQILRNRAKSNLIDNSETIQQNCEEIEKRLHMLREDEMRLRQVLEKIDHEKEGFIREKFDEVNRNFNNIFSVLLPGANCRLVQLDRHSILK